MLANHPVRIVAVACMDIKEQSKSYSHHNICGNKNIYSRHTYTYIYIDFIGTH